METERISIDHLTTDPANVRKHGERNLETIKASLKRFGQQKPIVVSADGVVVAGNGTLEAARALGWTAIDVVRTPLSGPEATAYAIADNRTAELAEWDDDALAQTLAALQIEDEALAEITGFDAKDIDRLIASTAGDVVEDEVPEPPADPITKPGDLWLLGEHRVLCGDSTKSESWLPLKIPDNSLCFTSPPYNLGKSMSLSGNKSMSAKASAYDEYNDNQTSESWRDMCDLMLSSAMHYCEAAVFNVQPLAGNRRDILRWIADRDEYRDIVTWDKGHAAPAMASGVMASRFEWMVIFGRGKSNRCVPLSSWRGTVSNVYSAPPQRNNEYAKLHGATFPVHLPAWVIGDLCNRAAAVVDCCMGTGTTLIAAEQLGRRCYGIEISPAYCDVIVKRWETLTGKQAELERQHAEA